MFYKNQKNIRIILLGLSNKFRQIILLFQTHLFRKILIEIGEKTTLSPFKPSVQFIQFMKDKFFLYQNMYRLSRHGLEKKCLSINLRTSKLLNQFKSIYFLVNTRRINKNSLTV